MPITAKFRCSFHCSLRPREFFSRLNSDRRDGDSLSPSFYLMFTAALSIITLMVVRNWEFRGELRWPETAAEAT